MTGYAAASADSPRGRLTLELRSVNARFLDMQFRVAEELRALEPLLREIIGARVSRGKLDCRFFLGESGVTGKPQRLDPQVLQRLKELSEQVRQAFPEAGSLRVADVLRWPGAIAEEPADEELLRKISADLCARVLDEFIASRGRGSRGMPSPRSAMMFFWICEVPPPMMRPSENMKSSGQIPLSRTRGSWRPSGP